MKNERNFFLATYALIAILHIGLMYMLLQWHNTPPIQANYGTIEFIDLEGFGGQAKSEGPAPEEIPPPEPEVIPPPKPELKPVITEKAQADIPPPKETPKPVKKKVKPKPKPIQQQAQQPQKPKVTNPITAEGGTGDGSSNIKTEGNSNGSGGSRNNPIKIIASIPRPPYPEISRENNEEGKVVLKVLVSPTNRIENVKVIQSSGYRRLDRVTVNAARFGSFDTQGRWLEYEIPVTFSLKDTH